MTNDNSKIKSSKETSIHSGHRKRVFNKYMEYGLDSFAEHEVLELILFYSIPRSDTNPLAHKLIREFGSLENVFLATPQELLTVEGVGERTAQLLSLFRDTREYLNTHSFKNNVLLDSIDKAGIFCMKYFSEHIKENAIMLSLDARNRLKKVTVISKGTIDETGFYPNEIMKTALNLRATAVVIAHNHPAGYLKPSPSDMILTIELEKALRGVNIALIDHILCNNTHFCSFRERGIFDKDKNKENQENEEKE